MITAYYSEDDGCYVATTDIYPSLSAFAESSDDACEELRILIESLEQEGNDGV